MISAVLFNRTRVLYRKAEDLCKRGMREEAEAAAAKVFFAEKPDDSIRGTAMRMYVRVMFDGFEAGGLDNDDLAKASGLLKKTAFPWQRSPTSYGQYLVFLETLKWDYSPFTAVERLFDQQQSKGGRWARKIRIVK